MTQYLLDANVLIALTVADHEHHDRASTWVATVDRFALCPIVEGALIRFLVRLGASADAAIEVLRKFHSHPSAEFWADSVSYRDADLGHVTGHRQVTEAYLAALAEAHPPARLATLDEDLERVRPDVVTLVPQLSR